MLVLNLSLEKMFVNGLLRHTSISYVDARMILKT